MRKGLLFSAIVATAAVRAWGQSAVILTQSIEHTAVVRGGYNPAASGLDRFTYDDVEITIDLITPSGQLWTASSNMTVRIHWQARGDDNLHGEVGRGWWSWWGGTINRYYDDGTTDNPNEDSILMLWGPGPGDHPPHDGPSHDWGSDWRDEAASYFAWNEEYDPDGCLQSAYREWLHWKDTQQWYVDVDRGGTVLHTFDFTLPGSYQRFARGQPFFYVIAGQGESSDATLSLSPGANTLRLVTRSKVSGKPPYGPSTESVTINVDPWPPSTPVVVDVVGGQLEWGDHVQPSGNALTLSWSASSDTGIGTISKYVVETTAGGQTWSDNVTSTSHTRDWSGYETGTAITYRVKAVDGVGNESGWSATKTVYLDRVESDGYSVSLPWGVGYALGGEDVQISGDWELGEGESRIWGSKISKVQIQYRVGGAGDFTTLSEDVFGQPGFDTTFSGNVARAAGVDQVVELRAVIHNPIGNVTVRDLGSITIPRLAARVTEVELPDAGARDAYVVGAARTPTYRLEFPVEEEPAYSGPPAAGLLGGGERHHDIEFTPSGPTVVRPLASADPPTEESKGSAYEAGAGWLRFLVRGTAGLRALESVDMVSRYKEDKEKNNASPIEITVDGQRTFNVPVKLAAMSLDADSLSIDASNSVAGAATEPVNGSLVAYPVLSTSTAGGADPVLQFEIRQPWESNLDSLTDNYAAIPTVGSADWEGDSLELGMAVWVVDREELEYMLYGSTEVTGANGLTMGDSGLGVGAFREGGEYAIHLGSVKRGTERVFVEKEGVYLVEVQLREQVLGVWNTMRVYFYLLVDNDAPTLGSAYLSSISGERLGGVDAPSDSRYVMVNVSVGDVESGIRRVVLWDEGIAGAELEALNDDQKMVTGSFTSRAHTMAPVLGAAYLDAKDLLGPEVSGQWQTIGANLTASAVDRAVSLEFADFGDTGRQFVYQIEVRNLKWYLRAGDTEKTLNVVVVDQAGHVRRVAGAATVLLDTQPLVMGDRRLGLSYSGESLGKGTLTVDLPTRSGGSDNRIARADVRSGGIPVTITSTRQEIYTEGGVERAKWGLDFQRSTVGSLSQEGKTATTLQIHVWDYAGNDLNSPVSFQVYPPPGFTAGVPEPTVLPLVVAPSADHVGYVLKWQGLSSATARYARILVRWADETQKAVGPGSGELTIPWQGTRPVLYIAQEVTNADSFEAAGAFVRLSAETAYTSLETSPPQAVLTRSGVDAGSEGEWWDQDFKLHWTSAKDTESGSSLTYQLVFRRVVNGSPQEWLAPRPQTGQQPLNAGTGYSPTEVVSWYSLPGALDDNGSVFDWKVRSTDGSGRWTDSGVVRVKLDLEAPEIGAAQEMVHDANPVIVGPEGLLRYTVSEGTSGLGVGAVMLSYPEGPYTEVTRTPGTGAGTWTAELPTGIEEGGLYRVRLTAKDVAGNEEVADFWVEADLEAPEVVRVVGTTYGDRYVVRGPGVNEIELYIEVEDDYSGLGGVEYAFVDSGVTAEPTVWNPATVATGEWAWGGVDKPTAVLELPGGTQDGEKLGVWIRAEDKVGNGASKRLGPEVWVDRTGLGGTFGLESGGVPVVLVTSIEQFSNGKIGPQGMIASASGVVKQEYALVASGQRAPTEAGAWKSGLSGLGSVTPQPVNGQSYRVVQRATNGVGSQGYFWSEPFTYEGRVLDPVVERKTSREVIAGEGAWWAILARDGSMPIAKVEYRFGDEEKWTESRSTSRIDYAVPEGTGLGPIQGSVRVTDALGQTKEVAGALEIEVVDADRLMVNDQGPWFAWNGEVAATWRLHTTSERTLQSVRYWIEGTSLGSWQTLSVPEGSGKEFGGSIWVRDTPEAPLGVVMGTSYVVEVEATDTEGVSYTGRSLGVVYDGTGPVVVVGAQVPAYATSTQLAVGWSVEDAESGIGRVRARLERVEAQQVVQDGESVAVPVNVVLSDWVTLGVESGEQLAVVSFGGLTEVVEDGQAVLVHLEVANGSGQIVDSMSGFAVIDSSAPPSPRVTDAGSYLNPQDLYVGSWTWSEDDPHSGSSYAWAIVTASEVGQSIGVDRWHAAEAGERVESLRAEEVSAAVGVADLQGQRVLMAVRARNGAGLESVGYSDGVIYDFTAPLLPRITIRTDGMELGESLDGGYVDTTGPLYVTVSSGEDASPIVANSIELGTLSETGAFRVNEQATPDWADAGDLTSKTFTLKKAQKDLFLRGQVFAVRAVVRNAAGLESQADSLGAVVDTSVPVVEMVVGSVSNTASGRLLSFAWGVQAMGPAPIDRVETRLQRLSPEGQSTIEQEWSATSSPLARGISFERGQGEASDGTYYLSVRATNAARGESDAVTAAGVALDTTPAWISREEVRDFVDRKLGFKLDATDSLSWITEYRYRVGSETDADAYQDDWMSTVVQAAASTVVEPVIDLVADTVRQPADGAKLKLYYMVRNSAGLWSSPVSSHPVLVDNTKPEGIRVWVQSYQTEENRISGIGIEGQDLQSGLEAYRLSYVEVVEPEEMPAPSGAGVGISGLAFRAEGLSIEELTLVDGVKYRVWVEFRNGAGTWSEGVGDEEVTQADRTGPALEFLNGNEVLVINEGAHEVPLGTYSDDIVRITYRLTPVGGTQAVDTQVYPAEGDQTYEEGHPFVWPYTFEQMETRTYELRATLKDKSEHRSESAVKLVRLNAPPQLFLGPQVTFPGKPESMQTLNMMDPDGDDGGFAVYVEYLEGDGRLGPDGEPIEVAAETFEWVPPEGFRPGQDYRVLTMNHPFYHPTSQDPQAEHPVRSLYAVQMTLVDALGKRSAPVAATVEVVNTQNGRLYVEEWWRGDHVMNGSILVPQGLTLHVAGGTRVQLTEGLTPLASYRLKVEGTLSAPEGAVWAGNLAADKLWQGIVVEGTSGSPANATLNGNDIAHADRGVVIGPNAVVALDYASIHDGSTGVHVLKDGQKLVGLTLSNLGAYGVKTEPGVKVELVGLVFDHVRRLVYDPTGRILTIEEMNDSTLGRVLEGSTGNVVQE